MSMFRLQVAPPALPIDPDTLQGGGGLLAPSNNGVKSGLFGVNPSLTRQQKWMIGGGAVKDVGASLQGGSAEYARQAYSDVLSQNMLAYKRQMIAAGLKSGAITPGQAIGALSGDDAIAKSAGDLANTLGGKAWDVANPKLERSDQGGYTTYVNPYTGAAGPKLGVTRSPNKPETMAEMMGAFGIGLGAGGGLAQPNVAPAFTAGPSPEVLQALQARAAAGDPKAQAAGAAIDGWPL
jgi:hypothetical protein